MEALGIEVIHLYGLTETGPFLTSCEWQPAWNALDVAERYRLKARQGIAQLLTDVRVMDEALREVPADGKAVGEIVARGNNVMEGYFKQPEETAIALRGGWLHTGDLAVVHADGYIEIVDRAKDVVVLLERCQDYDLRLRATGKYLAGGCDAVEVGHADVHEDDVGMKSPHVLDRATPVGSLADDLDGLIARENSSKTRPHQVVVVDQKHTNPLAAHCSPFT